jgi:hypothetical protein
VCFCSLCVFFIFSPLLSDFLIAPQVRRRGAHAAAATGSLPAVQVSERASDLVSAGRADAPRSDKYGFLSSFARVLGALRDSMRHRPYEKDNSGNGFTRTNIEIHTGSDDVVAGNTRETTRENINSCCIVLREKNTSVSTRSRFV